MEHEFNNELPIYLQLAKMIENDIISGRMNPGDKLISVREMAFNYTVNPNTVQRALNELENRGLISTERTTGKFITEDITILDQIRKQRITELSESYLASMKLLGTNENETIDCLKEAIRKREEHHG